MNSSTCSESLIKNSTISSMNNKNEPTKLEQKDDLENNEKNASSGNDNDRLSLKINEHDLDKYFQKEGRSSEQHEISTSLKTIVLDENRNSQIIVDSLEEQKKV